MVTSGAERESQSKMRFLAGMSHELRTPLNGMLGQARLLRMEGGLSPAQAARVEAILEAGSHLLDVVHGVLDLSGIEPGRADNPAEGCVFRLEVPMAASAPAGRRPHEEWHVLVVDDVPMNREVAEGFLRLAGHAATCADSGAAALIAAEATDFDAILMDIRMPGMDGLETTRRIRAIAGPRGRVALTAQVFTEQVEACRQAGMDGHLAKPFTPDSLIEALSRSIAAHRRNTAVASPAEPAFGAEVPVLDRAVLKRLQGMLDGESIKTHLRTLADKAQALLRQIQSDADNGAEAAEAAHVLAGAAGLFGFARLAHVARHFERAVQSGAPDAPQRRGDLAVTLAATLVEMEGRDPAVTHR